MQLDPVTTFLAEAARHAPSADNQQPWCIAPGKPGKLTIGFACGRLGRQAEFGALSHATLLGVGAVEENLSQASRAISLEAQLLRWPRVGMSTPYLQVAWPTDSMIEGAPAPRDDLPLFGRHTNRNPFRKDPVSPEVRGACDVALVGKTRVEWFTGKAVVEVARWVSTASRARFQVRAVHEWLGRSLRFSADEVARGDGLDVDTLALPLGGAGMLKYLTPWRRMHRFNRVGGYRLMAAIESAPVRKAPVMIAIIGGGTRDDVLDAGRVMQRLWIALNLQGLAVQPYYVVTDQLARWRAREVPPRLAPALESLSERLETGLELAPGEQLHMLLRVGWPSCSAKRSLRLPVSVLAKCD